MEVQEHRAGLYVRSTSNVGRVRLGMVDITVVPKMRWDAFLPLLRYAYGLRNLRRLPPTTQPTQDLGFQDIVVWQLVEEAQRLLGRGLSRAYARQEEALGSPRGRIDFRMLVGRGSLVEATLPCIYHCRDDDRLLNRVLLAGLRLAASVANDRCLRAKAGKLGDLLGETITPVRLDRQVFRRLEGEMDRTTKAYEPTVSLIRILHEGGGLSLDEGEVGPRLPGFLFDMNQFFQVLVGRYLADNLPEHAVRSEHGLRGMLAYVPGWNPRRIQAPTPRPDFVVVQGEQTVAILDAKYRDLWEKPLPRDMLYQLTIYAMSHEGRTASIVYPTTHIQATEARIEVRDPLNGRPHALIALRPIVLARLQELVSAKPTSAVVRERQSFAREVVFGRLSSSH
jgi:5-methylcytosine-specific restriction enzyme subunit McrC